MLPTTDLVRDKVSAVLADPLFWFPLRHHSPACARFLEAALLERRPKVIFLEAPAETNHLLPHLCDSRTQPPVAIYSSYRDDTNCLGLAGIASPAADIAPRFSTWYPLLPYSPEYVTLQIAKQIPAEVVFVDLPHHALIRPADPTTPPPQGQTPPKEQLLFENDFYHSLAKAGGYRTWGEAWDCLFEVREFADVDSFRRELLTFCAAARTTSDPARWQRDGTLERERFMNHTLRSTLADRKLSPEQAMVVCGGFHCFLDRNDPAPPPTPPPGTLYSTVVPYSYFRFSELSGYGAGNRAPRYYQTLYELSRNGRASDVAIEHTLEVLEQARKLKQPLSSADAIAVMQHADLLSRLRGRTLPTLDDLMDALISCCCKGVPHDEGRYLLQALDLANIGTRLGKVTPEIGRLPLLNDFYSQLSDLDLGALLEREKRIVVDLDKRDPLGQRRSAFLHRVAFLEVPIGSREEMHSTFKERWALAWNPRIEETLIEQSLLGDSVETAAMSQLREKLLAEAGLAGATCKRLVDASQMDFADLVTHAEKLCGQAIDSDDRFVSLSEALLHLCVLERSAAHRQLRKHELDALIVRCFDRACFALSGAIAVPVDQQNSVMEALRALGEQVVRGGSNLDRELFTQQVRQASHDSPVPFLRGAFLGMLAELRDIPPEELAKEVSSLARAPQDVMIVAGEFIDGVLSVSRSSLMLGADTLVAAIDELVRNATWDSFLLMLPKLRAAFERLHERSRDSMAERVARRYGLKEVEEVRQLDTSLEAATKLVEIDREVARIMAKWSFE
jgi:hypothetical protein